MSARYALTYLQSRAGPCWPSMLHRVLRSNNFLHKKTAWGPATLELLLFRLGAWEALLILQAKLPTAMPGGFDEQWHDPLDAKPLRRTLADTGSIQPMRLGQVPPAAVVLRQPS